MRFATENLMLLELASTVMQPVEARTVWDALDATRGLYGADHWVFATFMPQAESLDCSRFISGCPPAWCQVYEKRRWYINDPTREYARLNSQAEVVSRIPLATRGQPEMFARAKEFGFVDGFVAPAHGPNNLRVGILYIAFAEASRLPIELFSNTRAALRSLADALLEWDSARARAQLLRETRLTDTERRFLRAALENYQAKDISRLLGTPVNHVNRTYGSAINKLGVANKHQAALLAQQHGLLPARFP